MNHIGPKMDQKRLKIVFLYNCLFAEILFAQHTLSEEIILNEVSLGGSPTISATLIRRMIWGHTYNFSGTRWTTILQTRARRLRASHFCCEFANLNQIKKLENFVFRIPSCTASISYIFIHFIYSSIHFHHWIKSFHLIKALCIFIGPESDHWLCLSLTD